MNTSSALRGLSFAFLFCLLAAACGPSQAELEAHDTQVAAAVFATQTASAPTLTPTFTPTPTSTPTPTKTPTPTLTPTPTEPPFTIPEGWVDYDMSDFRIAMPEGWKVVDLTEEDFDTIMEGLGAVNEEWARNWIAMFTSEAIKKSLKLLAMDPEPAGVGYPSLNITYERKILPTDIDDLCEQIPEAYSQFGFQPIQVDCNLQINGQDAIRISVSVSAGPYKVQQYQYMFLSGKDTWVISIGVDQNHWEEYEPLFVQIAETFRLTAANP